MVRENYKSIGIHEEFSAWMVELLPDSPFKDYLNFGEIRKHFIDVDKLAMDTQDNPILITGMSVLPHIGTLHYHIKANDEVIKMEDRKCLNIYSQSEYFIDDTITDHSRFKTFTANVPMRRQKQVAIHMPVFQDLKTNVQEIVLDHFGFGMCNTALQVTYSCKNNFRLEWSSDRQ
jgi:hypothetical protein